MSIPGKEGEPIKGICYIHSETGTEGGLLSVLADIPAKGYWERLHYIKRGDYLTVYSLRRPRRVLWSGIVDSPTRYFDSFEVRGLYELPAPSGVRRKTWIEYFIKNYPASLIEAKREELPKPEPIKFYWEENPSDTAILTKEDRHFADMQQMAALDPKTRLAEEFSSFGRRWINRYMEVWGERAVRSIDPKQYWVEYDKFIDEENKRDAGKNPT